MIRHVNVENISDQIGERLIQAREKAGLSVDDISHRTRIPKTVVHALEAADFSSFSSPTYAKSFLSQYSAFLNVDAGLWLDALEPASFISGDFMQPLWKSAEDRKEEKPLESGSPVGWLSAASVLVASGALVFAAMKGYQFLDARYGAEPASAKNQMEYIPESPPEKPSTLSPSAAPLNVPPVPVPEKLNDALPEPPPRAIIVR